jgi:thiol-disulfide isomerase/thioredoxin
MKKNIIALFALLLLAVATNAQGIEFKKFDWDENLKQASAENKLVYVDFYTTWCGPCKYMAKKYFPDSKAGSFHNKSFINLKIDAEKEGLELAKKYNIKGYPTNVYINPKNEEVVFRIMGVPKNVDEFVNNGKGAIEEYNDPMTLIQYGEKMGEGDSSKTFTMKYLKKLTRLGKSNQYPLDVYSSQFFKKNPDSVEFKFMDKYMKHVDNNTFTIFMKNKKAYNRYAAKAHPDFTWKEALKNKLYETNSFASNSGDGQLHVLCKKMVEDYLPENEKINQLYSLGRSFYRGKDSLQFVKNEYDYADKLSNASSGFYKSNNKDMLASVMKQLEWQSKKWPPNMLSKLDSIKSAYSKDKKYNQRMTMMAVTHLNSQAWNVFENDGDQWDRALLWAKKAYQLSNEAKHSQSAVADTYANLLFVTGNKSEAIKMEKAAIKQAKKDGEDTSSYEELLKKWTD